MRKLGFTLAIVGSLAAIAAVGTAGASWLFRDTKTVRYAVEQPVERIVVEGPSDVEVLATNRSDVSVERTTTSFIEEPTSSWAVVDGVLRIESRCEEDWAFFDQCSVDYEIEIPAGARLEIETEHGDVGVRGALAELRVQTEHGDVGVQGSLESVIAESKHGDVDVDLDEPASAIEARSKHGDVEVSLPSGAYRVAVSTEHGDTSIEGIVRDAASERTIEALTKHGDVTLRGR